MLLLLSYISECHSDKAGLLLCGSRYQRRYQIDTAGIGVEINIINNIGADH